MTLTVSAQTTNRYTILGKQMTWELYIAGGQATIGGTLNTNLQCTIPASKSSKNLTGFALPMVNGDAALILARSFMTASGTVLSISKSDGSNWAAGASCQIGPFSITFEIN
jgi:hypothetical protein